MGFHELLLYGCENASHIFGKLMITMVLNHKTIVMRINFGGASGQKALISQSIIEIQPSK
jgi:hypothetical protein